MLFLFIISAVNHETVLSELSGRERAEHVAVEELEAQLHSQREVQECQQQIVDIQQRLSESSSDIIAKRSEITSLEAECQKLVSANNNGISDKIDRRRYFIATQHD